MTAGVLRAAILSAVCVLNVIAAQAQTYPSRTVEIVVPFAAGGGSDLLARMIGEGLGKRLGQSFVPLNRPGANTNTGTLQVVKAAPDGYSILISSVGLAANPLLYKRLPFDTLRDLSPITLIASSPTILVVPPALPANTLAEFVAYLKAHPGALNYASYGAGSSPHLATELFLSMTGTKAVHVPYPGGGPAAIGVMGNNVQMLLSSVLPVLGLVRGGQLKPIAIASTRRSPLLPDVPTFAESGVDYRFSTWFGLLAPAKTPDDIIATLHRHTVDTLREPAVQARVAEQGAEVVANTPAEFRAFIKDEMERFAVVIRNANMQLD
jgi:tripartite-type tricarboxylate transporter receptor subunit TctC